MDIRFGSHTQGAQLSNLYPREFMLDGIYIKSMEGWLQSLKWSNSNKQQEICRLVEFDAKRAGQKKRWQTTQTLWWKGEPIKRESQEYQDLLDRAYIALYTNNSKAKKALLATKDATLTHAIGHTNAKETVLTKREFCSRLMKIRTDLQITEFVEF